ncbi:MAG: hypothetical protein AAFX79_04680 [Planctomycetota bacterium]
MRALRPLAGIFAVLLLSAAAWSQPQPAPPDAYAPQGLARAALMDLRMQASPDERDYRIAQLGLGLARSLSPADVPLLRAEIEAAWSAGRDGDALALTRELVRLDPDDDVALLRVIASGIDAMQTVEDRMAAYERLLGAGGGRLPATVRSRLALDAALLARETGDTERFVDWLATASELDPTNKQAASLILTVYDQGGADPAGRFELLLNLLMADPVDANVYKTVSDELAQRGAFAQALRFFELEQRLRTAAGTPGGAAAALHRVRLRWLADGPRGLANELELPLLQERARLESIRELMQQRGQSLEGMQTPEQIVPPPDASMLRMLMATAEGDDAAASRASEDLRRAVGQRLQQLLLNVRDRDEARQVALLATRVRAENGIAMIIAGTQRELVRADIRQANEAFDRAMAEEGPLAEIDPAAVEPSREQLNLVNHLLAALDAIGTPEADTRLAVLESKIGVVPLASIAYTHALLEHGRVEDALPRLAGFARGVPATTWGAWANQRLFDLGVNPGFEHAAALSSLASAVPPWLDRMTEKPERFMDLSVASPRSEEHPTSFTRLRIRLRNTSPMPLAVGPNAPLNSRVLLAPSIDADLDSLGGLAVPEVASLDHRLRLEPGETLEAEVLVGAGLTGWFLEACGTRTTRVRWRAMQGFVASGGQSYRAGPMCLTAETGLVVRRPLPEAQLPSNRLATRFIADAEGVLTSLAAAIKASIAGPDSARLRRTAEFYAPVVAAAAQRFAQLSPEARLALLGAVPNARMSAALAPFDQAALASEEPALLAAALLTRGSDPEHEAFDRASSAEDPRVAELAALLRARLRDGRATYAAFRGFTASGIAAAADRQPTRQPSGQPATPGP